MECIKTLRRHLEGLMKKSIIVVCALVISFIFSNCADALCINVSEANLRGGPGTKYEKTWEVFKYMPFNKLSKKGNWFKVKDVDGDVHWVYRKLVTEKLECAVVKVDKANIRSGPGTKYNKSALSPALKYDSFKVVKRDASWIKVTDEFGDSGWIFRKLLWIH
jgi:SH3-like domain-containing protein